MAKHSDEAAPEPAGHPGIADAVLQSSRAAARRQEPLRHELIESFGIAVRQLREARGWSQEQLAARSELNRSYVGEIERGRVIASIVTAQKLAHALKLSIGSLLAHSEQLTQLRASQRINLAGVAL